MLTYFVIIPVLIAVFLFLFASSKAARVIAIIFQAIFTGFCLYLVALTRDTSITTYVGGYDGILGILLYAYDASAIFVLLTAALFLVVSIYSFNESNQRLFWCLLFLLEGALVGLFLTRDLFNMFVMVEVSTVVVVILLMYHRSRRNMYMGMIYLMGSVIAMQLYLFGLAYLYMLTGGFDLYHIAAVIEAIPREELVLPYSLIITGLAFKAGFIPIIAAIPKVKLYPGAPSGFVAILSGVHAKVSLFLFMRIQEMFGAVAHHDLFLVLGIIGAITGAIMAMSANDGKIVLAWHTVSQCGLILVGISLGMATGNNYVMHGALYHIVAHGIFKSALFLTAGIILKSYGTMNVYKVRGVLKRMPVVGVATAVAILGIMGAPLFIGSISKYYLGYGVSDTMTWMLRIMSLATIISFIKYGSMLFGKDNPALKGEEVSPSIWRSLPSLLWVVFVVAGGLLGPAAVNMMFGNSLDLTVSTGLLTSWGYWEKALWFFGSVAVGVPMYLYIVKPSKLLKKLGKMDLSFKTIIASTMAFLGIVIVFVGIL